MSVHVGYYGNLSVTYCCPLCYDVIDLNYYSFFQVLEEDYYTGLGWGVMWSHNPRAWDNYQQYQRCVLHERCYREYYGLGDYDELFPPTSNFWEPPILSYDFCRSETPTFEITRTISEGSWNHY